MSKIAVIDSGSGGITTLCTIKNLLPFEDFIYIADKTATSYGDKSENYIRERVLYIHDLLIKTEDIKAVLVACNTATGAGIEQLRESNTDIIYAGVEPAIKPAVNELCFGKILILLTPATAKQQKFLRLIESFDLYKDKMIIAPMPTLAGLIESNINHNPSMIKYSLQALLKPFKDMQIESVVLGCTHYCLIKHYISDYFQAKIYDGNAGAAIRLYGILKQRNLISRSGGSIKFIRV